VPGPLDLNQALTRPTSDKNLGSNKFKLANFIVSSFSRGVKEGDAVGWHPQITWKGDGIPE
jgi:hypothetical protein